MIIVFMRSNEYGYEEFYYESLAEAVAGIQRLYDQADGDGVEREIGVKVNRVAEGREEIIGMFPIDRNGGVNFNDNYILAFE